MASPFDDQRDKLEYLKAVVVIGKCLSLLLIISVDTSIQL